jgi:ATP-dependent DNA helicase RecG
MKPTELNNLLLELLQLPKETEWLEFKQAKRNFHFDDLGKYFSALSNEANLKKKECSWLVFGVDDNRNIIGSQYRKNRADLDNLKSEIAKHTTGNISFIEIFELNLSEGRVIMFQIPPAPKGIPVAWKGHYYGRHDEALSALNIQEIEQIRNQARHYDWSAQICEGATINDLDKDALSKARELFKEKNPRLAEEVDQWHDAEFLNKAKITIQNKITNTSIILLGKMESEHFISPALAQITWILQDNDNVNLDYEHFHPPLILNVENALNKIRNLKYRYIVTQTLFPTEINKYEPWVIREALHNCIAHQDYELGGRIVITERADELYFSNLGSFIPGSIENVIKQNYPIEKLRNPLLTATMVNLNMIDTIGAGIIRMFTYQKNRYFPLPDYDLTKQDRIIVKIHGKILDENYTRLLIENTDLDLGTVILLDKVQKRKKLNKNEFKILKSKKLVEGRYPNLYVTSQIASVSGEKARYIKNRAFDDDHYKRMILAFIKKYGSARREEIDDLLREKLSDTLNFRQKKNKIKNLLYTLSKRDQSIKNTGTSRHPVWVLNK